MDDERDVKSGVKRTGATVPLIFVRTRRNIAEAEERVNLSVVPNERNTLIVDGAITAATTAAATSATTAATAESAKSERLNWRLVESGQVRIL